MWDPNNVGNDTSGAAGTWNTTSPQWFNGTETVAWDASASNTNMAVFTGTTVSIGSSNVSYDVAFTGTRYVGGIINNVTGNSNWLLGSGLGSTLALNGSSPSIQVTDGQNNIQVNAVITGTGLTKMGAGGLRINQAGSWTGVTTVSQGALYNNINNGVSTLSSLAVAPGAVFDMLGRSQSILSISGAGTIRNRSTTTAQALTITGAAISTFSGTLTNTDAALHFVVNGSGTQLSLTGTNSYNGTTTVTAGTLKLGSSLTASSSVTVNGGTLSGNDATANITLGTGDVSMSSGNITPGGAGTVGSYIVAANRSFTTTGGTLNFNLQGASSFDTITSSGTASFSLTDTTLALSGTFTSVAGTYQLFSGFGGTNSITGLNITGIGSGLTGSLGTNGLLTLAAIPEPSTYASVLGVLTFGCVAFRRRSSRR